MDKASYCETLRRELTDVRIRMNEIRHRLARETGSARVRDIGDLALLERRETALLERLNRARAMEDTLWGRIRTELERDLDDLMGAFGR